MMPGFCGRGGKRGLVVVFAGVFAEDRGGGLLAGVWMAGLRLWNGRREV